MATAAASIDDPGRNEVCGNSEAAVHAPIAVRSVLPMPQRSFMNLSSASEAVRDDSRDKSLALQQFGTSSLLPEAIGDESVVREDNRQRIDSSSESRDKSLSFPQFGTGSLLPEAVRDESMLREGNRLLPQGIDGGFMNLSSSRVSEAGADGNQTIEPGYLNRGSSRISETVGDESVVRGPGFANLGSSRVSGTVGDESAVRSLPQRIGRGFVSFSNSRVSDTVGDEPSVIRDGNGRSFSVPARMGLSASMELPGMSFEDSSATPSMMANEQTGTSIENSGVTSLGSTMRDVEQMDASEESQAALVGQDSSTAPIEATCAVNSAFFDELLTTDPTQSASGALMKPSSSEYTMEQLFASSSEQKDGKGLSALSCTLPLMSDVSPASTPSGDDRTKVVVEKDAELPPLPSVQETEEMLGAQKALFDSQLEELKKLMDVQYSLTGINPLFQDLGSGVLEPKAGKRPEESLPAEAGKFLRDVFALKDTITKKEARDLSMITGVPRTQIREYFMGQQARVKRLLQLITDGTANVDANKPVQRSLFFPTNVSGITSLSSLESVERLLESMRTESTFTGQSNVLQIILQTDHVQTLRLFLDKGGLRLLSRWLNQAVIEEQTSHILLIQKVLCNLPMVHANPTHVSPIVQTLSKLRFYFAADVATRARTLLAKWSKLFSRNGVGKILDSKKNENASAGAIGGQESGRQSSLGGQSPAAVGPEKKRLRTESVSSDKNTEASRAQNKSLSQPNLKGLDMSERPSSSSNLRRSLQTVEDPAMNQASKKRLADLGKEKRRVVLVEETSATTRRVRDGETRKSTSTDKGSRPLSVDDIRKAKMRARLLQGSKPAIPRPQEGSPQGPKPTTPRPQEESPQVPNDSSLPEPNVPVQPETSNGHFQAAHTLPPVRQETVQQAQVARQESPPVRQDPVAPSRQDSITQNQLPPQVRQHPPHIRQEPPQLPPRDPPHPRQRPPQVRQDPVVPSYTRQEPPQVRQEPLALFPPQVRPESVMIPPISVSQVHTRQEPPQIRQESVMSPSFLPPQVHTRQEPPQVRRDTVPPPFLPPQVRKDSIPQFQEGPMPPPILPPQLRQEPQVRQDPVPPPQLRQDMPSVPFSGLPSSLLPSLSVPKPLEDIKPSSTEKNDFGEQRELSPVQERKEGGDGKHEGAESVKEDIKVEEALGTYPLDFDPRLLISEMLKRVISWCIPPVIAIDPQWHVALGEESKERDIQTLRVKREKEEFYPDLENIPKDPKAPWDEEPDYDDSLTLQVPLEPVEEDAQEVSSQQMVKSQPSQSTLGQTSLPGQPGPFSQPILSQPPSVISQPPPPIHSQSSSSILGQPSSYVRPLVQAHSQLPPIHGQVPQVHRQPPPVPPHPLPGQPGQQPPLHGQPGQQPPIHGQPGQQPPIHGQPGQQPPIHGQPPAGHDPQLLALLLRNPALVSELASAQKLNNTAQFQPQQHQVVPQQATIPYMSRPPETQPYTPYVNPVPNPYIPNTVNAPANIPYAGQHPGSNLFTAQQQNIGSNPLAGPANQSSNLFTAHGTAWNIQQHRPQQGYKYTQGREYTPDVGGGWNKHVSNNNIPFGNSNQGIGMPSQQQQPHQQTHHHLINNMAVRQRQNTSTQQQQTWFNPKRPSW